MIVYVRVKSSVKVTFKVDPRFGATDELAAGWLRFAEDLGDLSVIVIEHASQQVCCSALEWFC